MSLALKNKMVLHTSYENWRPSASLANLRMRAKIWALIREFFAARKVLEVETPVLCHTSVTDPFIESIPALFQTHAATASITYFLQTSPEYAMKRLLAAGSGCIYQITKAFRQGEIGRLHNPEFSMLEWYRVNFDHHNLMDEMDALLQYVLQTKPAHRKTYTQLFQDALQIDPHHASLEELAACARQNKININNVIEDRDTWLQLLMSECIEPQLGFDRPCFVYNFPASQAALARLIVSDDPKIPTVAARFEVYIEGMELANGFHELQQAEEQRKRFEQNQVLRKSADLPHIAIDEYFLAALSHGLPDCAGVALGLDRLLMLATQAKHIADILSFDFSRV